MSRLFVIAAGTLFSLGLGISGMTQTAKHVGFLDFAGAWDPSLLFVMGGAIGVNFVLFRVSTQREAPLFAPRFMVPTRTDIDVRLVGGAALFGIGWGMAAYCPGPGLAALGTATLKPAVFVVCMAAGMKLFNVVLAWRERKATSEELVDA